MDKIEASSDSSPYFSSPSSFASFSKAVTVTAQTQVPVSSQDPRTILTILGSAFYDQPVHILAKALLGKVIVRQLEDGTQLRGRIVETEAYPGSTDQASHTFRGRTERNAAMFERAGTAYVYFIYGMYHCLNISALEPGAGVLIRAIQPTAGLDRLRIFRKGGATMTATQLCNGPGRLCQAFDITTSVFNKHDLHSGQSLWLEHDPDPQTMTVVAAKRIGINPRSCGEQSVQQLWRYYLLGCPDVSKRDRISEAKLGLQSGTIAAGGSSFDKDRKNIRKPRKVKESCSLGQL